MGVTKDFIMATIADAMTPTFRRPMEDLIYETLDRRQIPTRTDFKEIRDLVNNLRGQVSGSVQSVRALHSKLEEVEDQGENEDLAEHLKPLEDKLQQLARELNYDSWKLSALVKWLEEGAELGIEHKESRMATRGPNSKSAKQYGVRVTDSIREWVEMGIAAGPFTEKDVEKMVEEGMEEIKVASRAKKRRRSSSSKPGAPFATRRLRILTRCSCS